MRHVIKQSGICVEQQVISRWSRNRWINVTVCIQYECRMYPGFKVKYRANTNMTIIRTFHMPSLLYLTQTPVMVRF